MDIIIKGAEEIKLDPLYIENLKSIPRASVPAYLEVLAKKNYLFIGFLFSQKLRSLVQGLSKISWAVYYPGFNGRPSSAFFRHKDVNTNISNEDVKGSDNTKQKESMYRYMKIERERSLKSSVIQNIAAIRKFLSNICLSLVILPGMLSSTYDIIF